MQGTQVWSLQQKDPTCCRAIKPVYHNYWIHTRAKELQLPSPCTPATEAREPWSPYFATRAATVSNEKPTYCSEEQPLLITSRESPHAASKIHLSQKQKNNWPYNVYDPTDSEPAIVKMFKTCGCFIVRLNQNMSLTIDCITIIFLFTSWIHTLI